MYQHPPQPQFNLNAFAANIHRLLMLAIDGLALSLEVFLHRGFGARYIGAQALTPIVVIGVWAVMVEPELDSGPLILFLLAYLLFVALARGQAFRRSLSGDTTHSRYTGTPLLMGRNSKANELTVKRFVEPVLALAAGIVCIEYNSPLGVYLIVAAICLFATNQHAAMWMRRRVMDMNDAVNEQEQVADRFRTMRGDNF